MKRSEDSKLIGLKEQILSRLKGTDDEAVSVEYWNKLMPRLDKGQTEHNNDYQEKDVIAEVDAELLDTGGWAAMAVKKYQYMGFETKELLIDFIIEVIRFYKKYKVYKEQFKILFGRLEEINLLDTLVDRVMNYVNSESDME